MSVLKNVEATPSRIRGVFRYLLNTRGQREKKSSLERILSPDYFVKDKPEKDRYSMARAAINEGIKSGLFISDNEDIALHPNLPVKAKNPQFGDEFLPTVLSQLFFNLDNYENHDLAILCAWYLHQDIFEAPTDSESMVESFSEQVGAIQISGLSDGETYKLNDERLRQFEYWFCFLNFGWRHSVLGKKAIVPDPTNYLRKVLKDVFKQKNSELIPVNEFILNLGRYCPVFESGAFRDEIEQKVGQREHNYLSSVTSVSLRRIEEEGLIKLDKLSDTAVWVFLDGSDSRISHITWLGDNLHGEQQ
ncbi:protein DpdG [Geitlerinema sp. PCC 7407]|uniref:protein DpdG n=1 Tax=Geitlerinema sp. PCC 7407 TaxID=1173025 RepID=UPI00029F97F6|nr:protein DpdG [Geitlerinema sp. PCC 7407]AFY67280.1 hypothetical protein GEI7407_2807 [Geitlerinema sp. PCC 7407]